MRDMSAVLAQVCAAGIPATMEHTGGGNWAIATGEYDQTAERFTGTFTGPVIARGGGFVAWREECYSGRDFGPDGGEAFTVPATWSDAALARHIIALHHTLCGVADR